LCANLRRGGEHRIPDNLFANVDVSRGHEREILSSIPRDRAVETGDGHLGFHAVSLFSPFASPVTGQKQGEFEARRESSLIEYLLKRVFYDVLGDFELLGDASILGAFH
jgi:hypothetical protein